jgi:enoyl-[acyl-carrier protein] reductase II
MSKVQSILDLYGIEFPVIQAGMVWVSSGKLAGASAAAGILGVVGAGSMRPDVLAHHIAKAQEAAKVVGKEGSIAVNLPLLYSGIEEQIQVALKAGIKHFITSAGTPKRFTPMLKDKGCTVTHVVSTPDLAVKCEKAGVDAVIAEGFEAGGHNGRDELTTLVLLPQVVRAVSIPVMAAGGIADGRGMAACLALGAAGVQMGTRFICTQESSAHPDFKRMVMEAGSTDTMLKMKKLVPVRLLKNAFYEQVEKLEERGAGIAELESLLGKGRAMKGMLEGDLQEGELEVGQIAGLIDDLPSVLELVGRLKVELREAIDYLHSLKFDF